MKYINKIVSYKPIEEKIFLSGIENQIPEIKVIFERGNIFRPINNTLDVADFSRSIIKDYIDTNEHIIILFLNRSLKIIGYYIHSIGGISSTTIDLKMIIGITFKLFADALIMVHNHPSGSITFSKEDISITKLLRNRCNYLNLRFLDSIVITKDAYDSMQESHLLGGLNYYKINGVVNNKEVKDDSLILLKLKAKALEIKLKLLKINNLNDNYNNLGDTIEEFDGFKIIIHQETERHHLPHFHVKYNEFNISINILNLEIIVGNLPKNILRKVIKWAKKNQQKLKDEYNNLNKK